MVTLINTNPIGAVELPLLAQFGRPILLEAGEEFDVPDDVAAVLLEQAGNYAKKGAAPAKKAAAKKAPAKKAAAKKAPAKKATAPADPPADADATSDDQNTEN